MPLSYDAIEAIHRTVCKQYGVPCSINRSTLEAIANKPSSFQGLSLSAGPFADAASLLKDIIQFHPFADGNKRTAVLACIYYLLTKDIMVALPLDTARYTVDIAKRNQSDDDGHHDHNEEIADWLRAHSATDGPRLIWKLLVYRGLPSIKLGILYMIGFRSYVERKISHMFALEIYGVQDVENYLKFLDKINLAYIIRYLKAPTGTAA